MKSMMNKMKDFFMPQDEYEEEELEEMEQRTEPKPRPAMQPVVPKPARVVPMGNPVGRQEILNLTMSSYDMTGEISNYIKARKPIVVNMQQLDATEVQRAVDYLTGACYALNGSVEKVAENIFIFAPEHISVSPEQVKQKNIWPSIG